MSKAARPLPKPGITNIHAYVPGKATAKGIALIRLSARCRPTRGRTPLGSSDKAQAAYETAERSLHVYPDPRASIIRTARGGALPPGA